MVNSNSFIERSIINQNNDAVLKYWNKNDTTKNIIIDILNNMDHKKKYIKWALENISNLFDFSCQTQQINFVLFVVLTFKNKYYAKISSGNIMDWVDIKSQKDIKYCNLISEPVSSWWLKGFNICSQLTECVICYEDTIDNIKTKCNHIFCRKCIGQHLLNKVNCPYCRTVLEADRRGNFYINRSFDNKYYFGHNLSYIFNPQPFRVYNY